MINQLQRPVIEKWFAIYGYTLPPKTVDLMLRGLNDLGLSDSLLYGPLYLVAYRYVKDRLGITTRTNDVAKMGALILHATLKKKDALASAEKMLGMCDTNEKDCLLKFVSTGVTSYNRDRHGAEHMLSEV